MYVLKCIFSIFLLALQPLHLTKIWFPSSELHSASFSWQLKSFASFYLNCSHLLPLHLLKRIFSLNQATTRWLYFFSFSTHLFLLSFIKYFLLSFSIKFVMNKSTPIFFKNLSYSTKNTNTK